MMLVHRRWYDSILFITVKLFDLLLYFAITYNLFNSSFSI